VLLCLYHKYSFRGRESIAPDRVNYNNPHMKDLCSSSEVVVPQVGWRIYNVVGCVKDFLSTPHPRRAERLEGVRAHAL